MVLFISQVWKFWSFSLSFYFLFPAAVISYQVVNVSSLHCKIAPSLVSLISVSSPSFSYINNMWMSVYVSLANILILTFSSTESLNGFSLFSQSSPDSDEWHGAISIFGSSQPCFLNVSSVTLTLYGCLRVAPCISTKWNFLAPWPVFGFVLHPSGSLLLTSSSYTGPFLFESSKYLLFVSLTFYLIIQTFCCFPVCDLLKFCGQLDFLTALEQKPWSQIPDPFAQVIGTH